MTVVNNQKECVLLCLLLAATLVTGCTVPEDISDISVLEDFFSTSNDGKNRSSLNPYSPQGVNQVLALQQFSLNPSRVLEGDTSSLTATFINKGEEEVTFYLGQKGRELLKNYCRDLFSAERYQATLKSQTRGVWEVKEEKVVLKPSERLETSWDLRAGQVPSPYTCQIELKWEYDYSVSTKKEIQIKRSDRVQTSQTSFKQSKRGLVGVDIETGSSSYLAGETIYAYVTVENKGGGIADIREIAVDYSQMSGSCDVPKAERLMLNPGAKRKFRCVISKEKLQQPSQIYSIGVRARYKYSLESARSLQIIK